jgi:HNH endonuclease
MSRGHPKSVTLTPDISFHRDNIRGVMQVQCYVCNKDFEKVPSEIRKNKKGKHYCSQKCYKIKTGKDEIKCDYCDKLFKEYKSDIARFKKHYCSRECYSKTKAGYHFNCGYKIIKKPGHLNCKKGGLISEHIWIMSEYLGRPLYPKETVHHKNGIRDDNCLENLELWDSSHPPGQRVSDKIKFYKKFLEKHGAKVDLSSISKIFDDQES